MQTIFYLRSVQHQAGFIFLFHEIITKNFFIIGNPVSVLPSPSSIPSSSCGGTKSIVRVNLSANFTLLSAFLPAYMLSRSGFPASRRRLHHNSIIITGQHGYMNQALHGIRRFHIESPGRHTWKSRLHKSLPHAVPYILFSSSLSVSRSASSALRSSWLDCFATWGRIC